MALKMVYVLNVCPKCGKKSADDGKNYKCPSCGEDLRIAGGMKEMDYYGLKRFCKNKWANDRKLRVWVE